MRKVVSSFRCTYVLETWTSKERSEIERANERMWKERIKCRPAGEILSGRPIFFLLSWKYE